MLAPALFALALIMPPTSRRLSSTLRTVSPRCANAVTNGMLSSSKYCLNICIRIKPERRAEFIECIKANQKGTLSVEPLAIDYLWGEDTETPNTFHFFEKYEGRAGFVVHTKAPHFIDWEVFAATDPFTAPPEVVFYEEM